MSKSLLFMLSKGEIMGKSTAIILSAGKGKRMGTDVSKQYLNLCGKPVIYYAIEAFENSFVDDIVLVVGKGDEDYIKKEIIERYNIKKVSAVVNGGAERYNSVYNGLEAASGSDVVLIHDGARAFITPEEINHIIEETHKNGACVAAVPSKDTVKISDADGFVKMTPDRCTVWNVQTPQAFKYELIREAYNNIIGNNNLPDTVNITDDAMVLELYDKEANIKLVRCSYENIKITTSEDMVIGESIINSRK